MSAVGNFKMFKWVPDGTYDYSGYLVRYVIVDCNPVTTIAKEWLDRGGPDDVSDELSSTNSIVYGLILLSFSFNFKL